MCLRAHVAPLYFCCIAYTEYVNTQVAPCCSSVCTLLVACQTRRRCRGPFSRLRAQRVRHIIELSTAGTTVFFALPHVTRIPGSFTSCQQATNKPCLPKSLSLRDTTVLVSSISSSRCLTWGKTSCYPIVDCFWCPSSQLLASDLQVQKAPKGVPGLTVSLATHHKAGERRKRVPLEPPAFCLLLLCPCMVGSGWILTYAVIAVFFPWLYKQRL